MVSEGNGVGIAERMRLDALERWRDQVDGERGTIMGDLGMIRGLLEGIKDDFIEVKGRLSNIEDKLEDRPSRAEIQKLDRDVGSLRAKAHGVRRAWTKLELSGPGGLNLKLLGVSGTTIVISVLLVALVVVTLVLLLKK